MTVVRDDTHDPITHPLHPLTPAAGHSLDQLQQNIVAHIVKAKVGLPENRED